VRERVRQNFIDLLTTTSSMPGYIAGYLLESQAASAEIGRVTIWESHDSADAAANDPHVMAVHSALMLDDRGTTLDWGLDAPVVVPAASEPSAQRTG
jgi:hypothetical protein